MNQNSNKQNALKAKMLIINLGTATQLTFGMGGKETESRSFGSWPGI